MTTTIITRDLPTTPHVGDFRLHCAALEWSLAEPIVIHSAEDIKSRVDWKDRVEPYRHQVENLMRFCRRLPVTLLADDVGIGKTISGKQVARRLRKEHVEEFRKIVGSSSFARAGARLVHAMP